MAEDPPTVRAQMGDIPVDSVQMRHVLDDVQRKLFGSSSSPPDRVSRYRLLERIGSGGMGVVYAAYDPELDRKVAVKLVGDKGGLSESDQERLLREAQALAQVSDPNVVAVFDAGRYEGSRGVGIFVVLEYLQGPTLREWLCERSRSWREIVEVFSQAGRGLAAAHARSIVHRDFKPSNVVLDRGLVPKVLDFGLARVARGAKGTDGFTYSASEASSGDATPRMELPITEHGVLLGTLHYMSPEQLRGEPADPSSDQYSFCVALYIALFGHPPFEGHTLDELREQRSAGDIQSPRREMGVPRKIRAAVLRGLSADPSARHRSMHDLVRQLRLRLWPSRVAVAAFFAALLLAVGVILVKRGIREERMRSCMASVEPLEGLWDADVRSHVQESFRRTRLPFWAESFSSVSSDLTRQSEGVAARRLESCRSTVEGRQTESMWRDRHACYNRRVAEIRALVNELRTVDAPTLLHMSVSEVLAPLSECDPDRVAKHVLASTPPAMARVHPLLAGARTRLALGRYEAAKEAAEHARWEAEKFDDPSLITRALILEGRLARALADSGSAEQHLTTALELADARGDDETATRAMLWLADAIAPDPSRRRESARLLRLARGRAERLAMEPLLRARILGELAEHEDHDRNYDAAVELYTRANDLRIQQLGAEHPDVALGLDALGVAELRRGNLPVARSHIQAGLELRVRALGPHHPVVGRSLNNLALVAQKTDLDEAIRLTQRGLETEARVLPPNHPSIATKVGNLGVLHAAAGDFPRALERHEHVVSMLSGRSDAPSLALVARSRLGAAHALQELGRNEEAEAAYGDAAERLAAAFGDEDPRTAKARAGQSYLRSLNERAGHRD